MATPGGAAAPTRVGGSARCPAPSVTPRTATSARSIVPASSGRFGRPADVQVGAGEAADRHVRVGDAGQPRQRQPVEHDVEIQILAGEADLAGDVDAAARLARATCSVADRPRSALSKPDVDRPERVVVAEHGDRRAGRDGHLRGHGVERAVRLGVQRQPPAHDLGAVPAQHARGRCRARPASRRRPATAQRAARPLLPELHGPVPSMRPPNTGPGELIAGDARARGRTSRPARAACARRRSTPLDDRRRPPTRIFELPVGLGVDARVSWRAAAAPISLEQPAEIVARPRPARDRSAGARVRPSPSRSPSRP